ncbi:MAG: hypothetical protein HY830_10250 [Actinobacteria bacterium]|nr:hypothetical protein [Actinomycetota bacterium]
MGHLIDLLPQLEAEWAARGVAAAKSLRPGLDPRTVSRRLADRGLVAPAELIDWFGWHDGVSDPEARAVSPTLSIMDLDECIAARDVRLPALLASQPDDVRWLPLLGDGSGNVLVVDCGALSSTRGSVTMMYRELDVPDADRHAASLSDPVIWWIEMYRTGTWGGAIGPFGNAVVESVLTPEQMDARWPRERRTDLLG